LSKWKRISTLRWKLFASLIPSHKVMWVFIQGLRPWLREYLFSVTTAHEGVEGLQTETRSSGKNLWCLLTFLCLNLYGETSKNYKLISIKFMDPFLCIISTSKNSNCIKYSSKICATTMFLIINIQKKHSYRICSYVYPLLYYKIWHPLHQLLPSNWAVNTDFVWPPCCYTFHKKLP